MRKDFLSSNPQAFTVAIIERLYSYQFLDMGFLPNFKSPILGTPRSMLLISKVSSFRRKCSVLMSLAQLLRY